MDEYEHHTQAEIKADQRGEFKSFGQWLEDNSALFTETYHDVRIDMGLEFRFFEERIKELYDEEKDEWEATNG